MRDIVTKWAAKHQIHLSWPEEFTMKSGAPYFSLAEQFDFEKNVCIDYGKFIERVPSCVLKPATLDQLLACVNFFNEQSIPYKTRGAGHSSGGQVLIEQGAVLDLSDLNQIVEDYPDQDEILAESGIWWLNLAEYLHPYKRRPAVLTDNYRTTVGGTLSVGGFGDTTHLYGLQIESVVGLTIVTADARLLRLRPEDPLFSYVLAGRGQLAIIAEARVKTLNRKSILASCVAKWNSVLNFVEDAISIIEGQKYEFLRMRILFDPESKHRNVVTGVLGNFSEEFPGTAGLQYAQFSSFKNFDSFDHYRQDPSENWKLCSPSVEIVFPLPDGLKLWQKFNKEILSSGLYRYLERGSSIMILRRNPDFPLAPFPDTEYCMMIAIRPAMPLGKVKEYLPLLRSFEFQALEQGAKIYLMSIESDHPNFLEKQFSASTLEVFKKLKSELDPQNLLNPGLLRA
jgi:hypothetical protein